ncbi:hypothetical protein CDD82_7941 [Ophiocordyceps australis]|uniref:Tetratricopeptide SHNi-TPR domain-containing protein n=1 Tax=Ophiocordyceps australis TaxID=1399860 RepID=A0A2C5YNW1_9HYPO|nr:hypothetical protein CDD82_7941 [Ophiocordyceps australis]
MAEAPAAEPSQPSNPSPTLTDQDSYPLDSEKMSDEEIKAQRVHLADLCAKGTALYARKDYEGASDILSQASILQSAVNGETAAENADILFHYGRSLFKLGQSKSDVLGAPAAATADKQSSAAKPDGVARTAATVPDDKPQSGPADAKKPLFQFTGDENFDDSDDQDDEDAQGQDDKQDDDNDDLATAFVILDLARVCYNKQLANIFAQDESAEEKGKDKAQADSPALRHIKERLADTHDCLAEIALENERYPSAIEDGRVSLNYKMELYPADTEIVAEAHYKLSLALEFASVTTARDDGHNEKRDAIDQSLRDEAIVEMERAISSFRGRVDSREQELKDTGEDSAEEVRLAMKDMKEVLADMEQRLLDLRKDPIDASSLLADAAAAPLGSILAGALDAEAVEKATAQATDLSNLVRKKAKPEDVSTKRKAENDDVAGEEPASPNKRTKVEGD